MPQTRAQIQRAYRERRRAAIAAVGGYADAGLLPVKSLSIVREFCSRLGTIKDWDDNDPRAIARAHDLAMQLALSLLDRDDGDGNGGNAGPKN